MDMCFKVFLSFITPRFWYERSWVWDSCKIHWAQTWLGYSFSPIRSQICLAARGNKLSMQSYSLQFIIMQYAVFRSNTCFNLNYTLNFIKLFFYSLPSNLRPFSSVPNSPLQPRPTSLCLALLGNCLGALPSAPSNSESLFPIYRLIWEANHLYFRWDNHMSRVLCKSYSEQHGMRG